MISPSPAPLSQALIRCGNCSYEGPGQSARSVIAQVLAWLCVFVAPLITILYFGVVPKYQCPNCKSTFLGVKNDRGIFTGQNGGRLAVTVLIYVIVVLVVIGLLSTVAVVALGSTRIKARDFKRLSDLKQMQSSLEVYEAEQHSYPTGQGISLGSGNYDCLNASGWQPTNCPNPYIDNIPSDPRDGRYVYSSDEKTFEIEAVLEGSIQGYTAGSIKAKPVGISQFKKDSEYLSK